MSCVCDRLLASGRVTGYQRTLHVFRSRKRYAFARSRLSQIGEVTEVFVANRYAFEVKLLRRILFDDDVADEI